MDNMPWEMSKFDKVWLQVGWLLNILAVALVLVLVRTMCRGSCADNRELTVTPVVDHLVVARDSRMTAAIYEIFSLQGRYLNPLAFFIATFNFALFALESEIAFNPTTAFMGSLVSDWLPCASMWSQLATTIILICLLGLRSTSAIAQSRWGHYKCGACWRYLVFDIYAYFDMVAVIPSILNIFMWRCHYCNVTWLSLVRTIDMMKYKPSTGAATRRLRHFEEDRPVIVVMLIMGGVMWAFFSGLYFVANRNNAESRWEAAEFKGEAWQRFESIPSSMFFVLLSLCREHPLASVFQTFLSRFIVVCVCMIGVPMFALSTGVFGSVLQQQAQKEIQEVHKRVALLTELGIIDHGSPCSDWHTTLAGVGREVLRRHRMSLLQRLDQNVFIQLIVGALSFGSVIIYFLFTSGPTRICFVGINVDRNMLALVDGLVGAIFFIEWTTRSFAGGQGYLQTTISIVDALSWPSGAMHAYLAATGHWDSIGDYLRAFCVVRVLKPERYMGAFFDMGSILSSQYAILKGTSFVTVGMWVSISILLYITERGSCDEEVRSNYGSVARALWAEVLNLHGEWIWCDFSALGKSIATCIAFFSTSICMVPIIIFSDGFLSKLQGQGVQPCANMQPWELRQCPPHDASRRKVYNLLYEHLLHDPRQRGRGKLSVTYQVFRAMSFLLTMSVVASTTLLTLNMQRKWDRYILLEDAAALCLICLEFVLRVQALGFGYVPSFVGVCNILSFLAILVSFWLNFCSSQPGDEVHLLAGSEVILIPLRLLRLFMFEAYVPALGSFAKVVRLNRTPLLKILYVLVSVWYIFTTLLYIFEHSSDSSTSLYYQDILTGLQYGLVHLTGDYPIYDYTLPSKVVHLFGMCLGMCCSAALAGLFSAGFIMHLGGKRALERRLEAEQRFHSVTMSVVCVIILQRRFRRSRVQSQSAVVTTMGRRACIRSWAAGIIRRSPGEEYDFIFVAHSALLLNLLNTFINSIPEVQQIQCAPLLFGTVELVTGAIFLSEYLLRLGAAPCWWRTFVKPVRLIDLCCLLPLTFWPYSCAALQLPSRRPLDMAMCAAMVLRVVRLLQFPPFSKSWKRASHALCLVLGCFVEPAVLAFNIWVITAGIFMCVEHIYDGPQKQNMATLLDTLYWTQIYLLGEWATVEFSPGAGSRLCIFYCLFGVALFAVPVGVAVEVVKSSLESVAERRKDRRLLFERAVEQSRKLEALRRRRVALTRMPSELEDVVPVRD